MATANSSTPLVLTDAQMRLALCHVWEGSINQTRSPTDVLSSEESITWFGFSDPVAVAQKRIAL